MSVFIIHVLFKLFNMNTLCLLSSLPLIALFTFSCILFLLALFCSFPLASSLTLCSHSFLLTLSLFLIILFCWMPHTHTEFFSLSHLISIFSVWFSFFYSFIHIFNFLFPPIIFVFTPLVIAFSFLFYLLSYFSFIFLTPPFSLFHPSSPSPPFPPLFLLLPILPLSYLSIYHF